MKRNLITYLLLSCKEATMMTAKREEGKLGRIANTQLSVHLALCKFCKRFNKASKIISSESKNIESKALLSNGAKDKIKELINQQP